MASVCVVSVARIQPRSPSQAISFFQRLVATMVDQAVSASSRESSALSASGWAKVRVRKRA